MSLGSSTIWLTFGLAFIVALIMTPVSIKIAHKVGALDIPKDQRRMHKKAMPLLGGMAIFLGTMIALLVFDIVNKRIRFAMLGGTLMYILGVVDDLKDLKASVKFTCQTAIAVLMYILGLRITFISNYFGTGHLNFGAISCFVITVLWIVGITNTINLIDGLDGLAAGISAIAALCIAYVAYIHGTINGMVPVCLAMMALAGACIGFLPYNFYPAKTFMGDGGALFLGFMIAILSVVGPLKRSTMVAVIVPVVALAIPIFDTSFAILRRVVNRQHIMQADKGHLHHRLIASGYGQRRAVIMMYGISAIMGMSAVLVSRELYKDAFILFLIAFGYLYVFLTDPSHKMPTIKAVRITDEDERENAAPEGPAPGTTAQAIDDGNVNDGIQQEGTEQKAV